MRTRTSGWLDQWHLRHSSRAALVVWRHVKPVQLFVGSFAVLIVLGTLGLRFLPGLYTGEPLGWVDALFTATSAVCVTGLIVVDTATYFTPLGQAFLLLLIQLGGLGIIAFTTLIILTLGLRLSLRHEALAGSPADVAPHIDTRRLARHIVQFTMLFEAVGATLLFLLWLPRHPIGEAAWHAVFHAISAFCNAGFSTFSDSLVDYGRSPLTLMVVMTLIVLGGLGFLTLEELYLQWRRRHQRSRERLSVHSRLVLVVTAILLIGAWAMFLLFEWRGSLGDMPAWAKLTNGLFMSVTARTAGFNTIDHAGAADSTNFLTILLMFVGGSPGSAAGGLKTTTVALIALIAWARFRGREIPYVWGRSLPAETTQRAVGLCVVAFGVVTLAILVYVTIEAEVGPGAGFLSYMFEATSAFNTVGLSMGVTADLSMPGRWLTIALMYVGRVGILSFAASIALPERTPARDFRFAYEEVIVG